MTRILLVYQPVDGGVGRHVTDLFDGLSTRGYDVALCGPARPIGAPSEAPHRPLALQRAVAPRADLATLTRFARIVRELRPDLIHAHSSKAGAVARLGKLLNRRPPVLYTPHGYAFAGFFDHELERRAYRETERLLARLTCRVITVCEAEARLAASVGPAGRIRIVHNGIDPVQDWPADPNVQELARHGPVVCTLTQLRPGKGLETLIDSLGSVLARHPTTQLVIVGDGPDKQALLARARDRGVAGALHFLGPSSDPMGVLRAADLFVLPSWAESFPYVILEAMTAGLAIVASDVGGVREALVNGESGLLVPARDSAAIARALIELLDDAGRRARLGDAARRSVATNFSRAAMIDGIDRVYQEALAHCNGTHA